MKQKNKIYYTILLLTTLLGLWLYPALVKKVTYKPDSYPFIHYSCMLDELCLIDYSNKKMPMQDLKGNVYTTAEFDSLMPMLNYRQLMSDGRLPDTIKGVAIEPKMLRLKSVVYKYMPNEVQTPQVGLYVMFESMPVRVGLEMPDDVFRLKDKIEFIDTKTNSVNEIKSQKFQEALDKSGYTFPTQWASGNPNIRKPYDEGYFCLDAKGQLYHLKMVNGRPYVKDTHVSDSINVAHFSMLEVADKRFYGFIFSKEGNIYILEENDGYKPLKLDIDPIDLNKDQVVIMGNMFDWTVSIITPDAKKAYGLNTVSLNRIGEYKIDRTLSKWDKVSKWLFPVYLTIEDKSSDYLFPVLNFTALTAFIANLVLAVISIFLMGNSSRKKVFNFIYIALTGIAGFVALLILPNLKKKF